MDMNNPKLILMDPQDNVFVTRQPIENGETLQFDTCQLMILENIPLGFKIARRSLRAGEKVIKYGVPIGSTTRDITAGEIIHVHNMMSDYLPTFARVEGQRYG